MVSRARLKESVTEHNAHAVANDQRVARACIIRPACLSLLAPNWGHMKFNQFSDSAAWVKFTAPVTRDSIARLL